MNTWIGSGFLSRDPDIKYSQTKNGEQLTIARFSIACQRKGKDAGADFIGCVAYGKTAEVLEKYFTKGRGVEVKGHIQTGSYINKDNQKVYTTDVIVDELEFPKVRKSEEQAEPTATHTQEPVNNAPASDNDFMQIPDADINDLPFK